MNNIRKERNISPLKKKKNLKGGSEQNEKGTHPTFPLGKELLETCVTRFSGGSLKTSFDMSIWSSYSQWSSLEKLK